MSSAFGQRFLRCQELGMENDLPILRMATVGDVARRLSLEKAAVEALSADTREYMHINEHGKPLPSWMEYSKRPSVNRCNYILSQLHTLMTDGSSSTAAMLVSNFMVLSIMVSVISFCLETIPSLQRDRNPVAARTFTWIEAVTIQIFAVDYLLRLLSAPAKLNFLWEPFNIIDLISIAPWYLVTIAKLDFDGTTVFRVVRLFRVFRVLKLGGRYSRLLVVLHALRRSVDMLGLMTFFISLSIVFWATLMYFAERGNWDSTLGYYVRPNEVSFKENGDPKPSPFESIVSGFWWAVASLMTVGYGDVFPISAAGKFIACVAVLCGVLTLALPISVIGATFTNDWDAHMEAERAAAAQGGLRAAATSPALRALQALVSSHLSHLTDLVSLHAASEAALDGARQGLHARLAAAKRQLHTEAKADVRLRRLAAQRIRLPRGLPLSLVERRSVEEPAGGGREGEAGGGGSQATTAAAAPPPAPSPGPYDRHYGYLPQGLIRERFCEQLGALQASAQALTRRGGHVGAMAGVDGLLLGAGLGAAVGAAVRRHGDLAFVLSKDRERSAAMRGLEEELAAVREELARAAAAAAAAGAAAETAAAARLDPSMLPPAAAAQGAAPGHVAGVAPDMA